MLKYKKMYEEYLEVTFNEGKEKEGEEDEE